MIKTVTFNYTGTVQSFTVPYNVISMIIECWGASGGGNNGLGGKGGYVKGTLLFPQNQTLYIYVGQTGQGVIGGWNGGGNSINSDGHGGGGASDVRTVLGSWNDSNSLKSRIIVAGGGGGSDNGLEGAYGGSGGGLTGGWGSGSGCGGPGSQTGSSGPNYGGLGYGGNGNNSDAGGGGGGYYGGGGSNGNNAGGGGGSSYYGTLSDPVTTTGVNVGNGKVVITYEYAPIKIFLEKDNSYYIIDKKYFNIYTKTFKALTIDDIAEGFPIIEDTDITKINEPFIVNEETFIPSDIIDFTQYKLCICYTGDDLYKSININYVPSNQALAQTQIKIKEKYIIENISNSFLDISSPDKSQIDYIIIYSSTNVLDENASLLNAEILKDDFYLDFKLNSSNSLLKSVTVYNRDSNNYNKIKDDDINVDADYIKTYITFNATYSEVLINKITKQHFKYLNETLDKF